MSGRSFLETCQEPLQRSVFPGDWVEDAEQNGHKTITAEEVCNRFGVPRYLVISRVERQIEQAAACQSLPFTMMLVISYASVAILHMNAPVVRAVEHSVRFDIEDNANFAFDVDVIGHKNVYDVNSAADFWSWMSKGLIPLLFIQERSWSEELLIMNQSTEPGIAPTQAFPRNQWGIMTYYNRIVGGVRMRQERASNETCDILPDLNDFYGRRCLGKYRDYSLEPDVRKARATDADEDKTIWFWVHLPINEALSEVENLELTDWLDPFTEKIEISIPIYNAEYSVHTLVIVNFYFSRGGHIWKRIITESCYATWFTGWYHYASDMIYGGCIGWMIVNEVIDMITTVISFGFRGLKEQYLSIWNIIDWISIVYGATLMVFFAMAIDYTGVVNKAGEAFGSRSFPVPLTVKNLPDVKKYVDELDMAVNWVTFLQRMLARYPLIIVFRLFKAFHAQPRLALVTLTLYASMEDLFHFLMVFFCVMLGFVTSAVVLFGREVTELATFERGLIWCTRLLFGDIEWEEMRTAGRILAGLWLMVFLVFASLLLLNMLLAIVMDAYSQVKESTTDTEPLWHQVGLLVKHLEGSHVSLKVVLKALEDDVPVELRINNKAPWDDALEEARAAFDRTCLKIEDLQRIVGKPRAAEKSLLSMMLGNTRKKVFSMKETQAAEIILGSIDDFYKDNLGEADTWNFIVRAEKINDRTQRVVATHKRFYGREAAQTEEEENVALSDMLAEDDEGHSATDEENDDQGEEEPYKERKAPSECGSVKSRIVVREAMSSLRADFLLFLKDFQSDRENAVSEVARLTAEVEALRDRVAESRTSGAWDNVFDDSVSNGGSSSSSAPHPTGQNRRSPEARRRSRLERLEEEHTSEANISDEDASIASSRSQQIEMPRASPHASSLEEHTEAANRQAAVKAAVYGSEFPLSRVAGDGTLSTARAPAPLSLPRNVDTSARNRRNPPAGGPKPHYQDFMEHHRILSSDFRAPSDTMSADWPDEISMPGSGSSPAGSNAGGGGGRRPRGSGSSAGGSSVGSHGRKDDDFGLNIMDLDLGDEDLNLDDFSGIEEQSDEEPGEGPLHIPHASGPAASSNIGSMSRVQATRVADGVGFSRDGHNGLQRAAPPTGHNEAPTQSYEFTNMKDAQSQLRFMLSKHQPERRSP